MKILIKLLKESEKLSAFAIRLTFITGKSQLPIHPKHLIKNKKIWFMNYLNKNQMFLDLGCGTGTDTIAASQKVKTAIGLDISKKSIKTAAQQLEKAKTKNVSFQKHDLNKKLPFDSDTFDVVLASDVLEHLERREFALRELRKVLKDKGLLLLVTDNPNTSWKKKQKKHGMFYYADSDHKYEYSKEEILELLKKHSFEVLKIDVVTYDTPFKGFIDLVGGISLSLYRYFSRWKKEMVKMHPEETTGFKIVSKLSK